MINTIRQLIRDTRSQKLRTLLTLFGMIWGTAAVSLLLAFGDGLHAQLAKSSAGMGNNVVIGWPSRTSLPFEGLSKGRQIQMDYRDIELIRNKAYGLGGISGEYMGGFKLQYGPKVLSVSVSGVEPDFGIPLWVLAVSVVVGVGVNLVHRGGRYRSDFCGPFNPRSRPRGQGPYSGR